MYALFKIIMCPNLDILHKHTRILPLFLYIKLYMFVLRPYRPLKQNYTIHILYTYVIVMRS